jgi:hypothetical protein
MLFIPFVLNFLHSQEILIVILELVPCDVFEDIEFTQVQYRVIQNVAESCCSNRVTIG